MNLESHLPLVLDLCLKSSAILLAAFGVAWLARAASAARRHLVWLAAFIALAILPLTLAIPPRWSWSWQRPVLASQTIQTTPAAVHESPSAIAETVPAQAAWKFPAWSVVAGGMWLAGVLALLGRQGAGFWKLRGLRRQSSPVTSGSVAEMTEEFGTMELRESPHCAVPLTWGWPRPVVLLPASAKAWPEAQLRAALAHEFGHIARRDFLSRQFAQIVRAFFWPNPLVWLAMRALHRTQEQACDDLVLRRGAAPREYAMQLLEATRALAAPMFTCPQAVAMAQPSTLEGRVRAIVDEHRDRSASDIGSRIAAATAIAAVIAGSAFAQVKSPAPETPAALQIMIEMKAIEAPAGTLGVSPAGDKAGRQRMLSVNEFQMELQKLNDMKGVDMLSTPKVITRSGQRATMEIGRSKDQLEPPGLKFDVVPTITADGRIRLVLKYTAGFVESGMVRTRTLETSASLASGQTLLIAGEAGDKGRMTLLTVTASVIGPDGLPPAKPVLPEQPQPAKILPGKPGFLTNPSAVAAGNPDVRGLAPGTGIKEPPAAKNLPAPNPTRALAAAERIVFPKLEFKNATIEDAVKILIEQSKANDPNGEGVKIVLQGIPPVDAQPRLTLSIKNVPLSAALKYITGLANLKFAVVGETILIAPIRDENTATSDIFLNAYIECGKAEKQEEAGDAVTALAFWKRAGVLLDQISREDPTWKPDMVKRRRTLTSEKIARLESGGSKPAGSP